MDSSPAFFAATGTIANFPVTRTGYYRIEAAGAQGGVGSGPGGKGARLAGTFHLTAGETLHILVGCQGKTGNPTQQPAGGGGGGTFVWKGPSAWPLPLQPLLAAGGGGGGAGGDGLVSREAGDGAACGGRHGYGGAADQEAFHYSGGGGAGWLGDGETGSTPTRCGGGSIWRGGAGANYCGIVGGTGGFGGGGGGAFIGSGSGGGGGYSGGGGGTQGGPHGGGGGSYNAGARQANQSGANLGDGFVSIIPVEADNELSLLNGHSPAHAATATAASPERLRNGPFGRGYF